MITPSISSWIQGSPTKVVTQGGKAKLSRFHNFHENYDGVARWYHRQVLNKQPQNQNVARSRLKVENMRLKWLVL
ncbi:MAG TPA: hypothetical protein DD729_04225 [Rhodobacteraceae bacterium]|jgi:hypothetical protein|nr:hypothetical protein [Paracoccaceae bacterium]